MPLLLLQHLRAGRGRECSGGTAPPVSHEDTATWAPSQCLHVTQPHRESNLPSLKCLLLIQTLSVNSVGRQFVNKLGSCLQTVHKQTLGVYISRRKWWARYNACRCCVSKHGIGLSWATNRTISQYVDMWEYIESWYSAINHLLQHLKIGWCLSDRISEVSSIYFQIYQKMVSIPTSFLLWGSA